MTALARVRRNRTIMAFVVGLLTLSVIPPLGWVAADALRTSTEGRDALAGLAPLITLPSTPTALLAGLDSAGEVATLTVFTLAPPEAGVARGGTVVVVPAGGDTFLPDGSRGRVADAYLQNGIDGLTSSVEGLLGITFDTAAALPADRIADVLQLGPVELNLELPVLTDSPFGDQETVEVFGTGPTTLDDGGIGLLLTASPSGEPEATRLPTLDTFWRAVSAKIGDGITLPADVPVTVGDAAPSDGGAELAAFLGRVFAGPVQTHTLAAELVEDEEENPDGLDLMRLDAAEVTVVFATVAFSAVSPLNPTLSLYVRSPLGDPELTKEAVARLILAGANVVLVTESPDIAVPNLTTVEYADDNEAPQAEAFADKLGTFSSQLSRLRIDGVDAIVTLGRSFADDVSASGPPTTPTGSVEPTASTTG